MPRVPRSVLRRSVFAVDGREEEEQRRKRHRESGDRLRRTAGLHLPIQSKGAKCDSRRPKIFRFALQAPDTAHTNHSLSSAKERIFQNHKKHKITLYPLVILLCCALSRSPVRRLPGVVHPSTSRQAVAPPCGRRTRPPYRDEENNTTFAPKSTPFRRKCTTLRHSPTRERHDTRPRIRTSVEVHFLPSPFTFTPTQLIYKCLRVNFTLIFCFTEVKAKGVKPSHLSPYCPTIYAQQVKR